MKSKTLWGACALSLALVCAPLSFATAAQSDAHKVTAQSAQGMAGYRDWSTREMRTVQKALIAHGADIEATGKWNDATREAVKDFQKAEGLNVTGFPNLATVAALGIEEPQ